jgi:hypothetical protein
MLYIAYPALIVYICIQVYILLNFADPEESLIQFFRRNGSIK